MKRTNRDTTIRDIAERLGLSQATVSMALNNKPVVNERTRAKILKCARDMRYTPNLLARGLALQRSLTIGVVCPDTENPCFGSMIKHISNQSKEYGYSVIVSVSQGDMSEEARCIQNFIDRKCDGIIIMPTDNVENDAEIFLRLRETGTPVVFCISYYRDFGGDCVMTDYADGSYKLTKYLLELGHRELWYLVTENTDIPVSRLRVEGYRRAYEEMGIPCDPCWIIGCRDINYKNGYQKIVQELNRRPAPDGILSLNDYTTFGVIRAAKEMWLRIPEDISIAGYDDVFYAKFATTPLTTVRQDLEGIARNALKLLLAKMNGAPRPEEPIQRLLEPVLVTRETTRDRRDHEQSKLRSIEPEPGV